MKHHMLRFTIIKDENMFVYQRKYHDCWYLGGRRSLDINSHDADLSDYTRLSPKRIDKYI